MTAQKSQLTAASAIAWTPSGIPFNGYVLLIMALPSSGGASWTSVNLRDSRPRLRVPTRIKVPIREGVYDPSNKIWQTSGLVPTSVKYASFFYDDTNRFINVGPALFTVTTDPYTLAPPSLTDPDAALTPPDPEDVPSSSTSILIFGEPDREDLAGTKNGVNQAFTASRTAAIAMVLWNGMVLDEGVGYIRSGVNYTMAIPPDSGDSLEVVLW